MIDTATAETTTTPTAPVASTPAPEASKSEAAPAKVETKPEVPKTPEDEDRILAEIYREAQADGDNKDEPAKDATGATGDDTEKPLRNERGQFVSTKPEPDAEQASVEKTAEPKAEAKTEEPKAKQPDALTEGHFRGWSKEKRDAFQKLPAETQSFVIQHQRDLQSQHSKREAELTKETKALQPLKETVSKWSRYLDIVGNALKQPTHEIIAGLMETEAGLRFGTHDQKVKILLGMARDYGINLAVDENAQEDPQVHDLRQEVARLRAIQDQDKRRQEYMQEQQASTKIQTDVEAFATATDENGELKHPHFDALRPAMSKLFASGEAATLEDAYRIASEPMRQAVEAEIRKLNSKKDLERATRIGRLNVTTAPVPVSKYANEDDLLTSVYRQAINA